MCIYIHTSMHTYCVLGDETEGLVNTGQVLYLELSYSYRPYNLLFVFKWEIMSFNTLLLENVPSLNWRQGTCYGQTGAFTTQRLDHELKGTPVVLGVATPLGGVHTFETGRFFEIRGPCEKTVLFSLKDIGSWRSIPFTRASHQWAEMFLCPKWTPRFRFSKRFAWASDLTSTPNVFLHAAFLRWSSKHSVIIFRVAISHSPYLHPKLQSRGLWPMLCRWPNR